MSKLNREFLVPYLQDVCALYMADLEVCAKMFGTQKEILILQRGEEIEPPAKPKHEESLGGFGCLVSGIGLFLLIAPIVCLFASIFDPSVTEGQRKLMIFLAFFCIPMGLFLFVPIRKEEHETKKTNKELDRQYKEAVRQYEIEERIVSARNEEARKKIHGLNKQINDLSEERKRIAKTLDTVYAANIIPSHYRDMYAAVYLCDFFSTSRSDNLDMALNTYVLEQIKDKLDVIIEKQRESILNQRLMLANQQKSLEEQRAHNAYMRQKVYQIASSIEEQNQYLAMIEGSSAATAYFAAANYLR